MAGGVPSQVERAKTALRSAAIGYGLAILAPVIVTVLNPWSAGDPPRPPGCAAAPPATGRGPRRRPARGLRRAHPGRLPGARTGPADRIQHADPPGRAPVTPAFSGRQP